MKRILGFDIRIVALHNKNYINPIIQYNFFHGDYLVGEEF